MKISAEQAEIFCNSPTANVRGVLFYGPDLGLVRERAEIATKAVAETLSDPFRVIEINSRSLQTDSSNLIDEICTVAMMGDRKVVRVREAADNCVTIIQEGIESKGEALLIVEAGELSPRSKLRMLFEKGSDVLAIPCYVDEGNALIQFVQNALESAQLKTPPGVSEWIAGNLGPDRMMNRIEIEKLALYAQGKNEISLEDAQAVIGDAAAVTLDKIAYAAGCGNQKELLLALDRAYFEGIAVISILRATIRHISRLEEAIMAISLGSTLDQSIKSLRPPVFFKQKNSFSRQLRLWDRRKTGRARAELLKTEIQCKRGILPDASLCERALMRIAFMAKRH